MSRLAMVCFAGLVLGTIGTSWAETRSVMIRFESGNGQPTRVSIWSDVKSECRHSVPLDEALKVVREMEGWGSAVLVFVVSENFISAGELKQLAAAIEKSLWLELTYLHAGLKLGLTNDVAKRMEAKLPPPKTFKKTK